MSASRGYTVGLVSVVVATSLAALGINTTVNPWRVTPMPWSSQALDPYRDIASQIRTAKAGLVRSNKSIGVAIVGSSRVATALDPEFAGWQRDDVVNLGCSGGFIYESTAIARYLLDRHKVEIILFGVDPGDLGSLIDTRPMGDFNASPLAGDADRFNRELRYLIGVSTLEASVQTLQRYSKDEPAQYTPKGLRVRQKNRPREAQADFLKSQIQGEAEFAPPDKGRNELNPEKARILADLMRESRRRGTRFVAFIHPTHALLHARAADAADPPVILAAERRAVLDLATRVNAEPLDGPPIEVWDFCGFHPLNCDPVPQDAASRMPRWNDLGHYTVEIGNLIQSRIMGWPVPVPAGENFGTRLTPDNIDGWFERVRHDYRAYLTGPGARDVAWKEDLITTAATKK